MSVELVSKVLAMAGAFVTASWTTSFTAQAARSGDPVPMAEHPSLAVTTERDVVDRNDNLISLREAFAYAMADAGTISEDGGYRISFDWASIQAEAEARGCVATGLFDLSAAPVDLAGTLRVKLPDGTYTNKYIILDGTLDKGGAMSMGAGGKMAEIRGMDFRQIAPGGLCSERAVVVGRQGEAETVITIVDEIETSVLSVLASANPVLASYQPKKVAARLMGATPLLGTDEVEAPPPSSAGSASIRRRA